ncbi:hypothetical protein EV385_1722 [Krasilnikovia cinnamomea]|uniref:Uncharacterized protein n=1 Tax=Krasilnikovia cinnamomea TaxID=349313 RepID=A0A4Q7ZID2_9ACTN|nr:hypothetical protein [Krasilnikovia cinnamomea]RZU49965.1 hypothetical protein EV385_1722 [Krasilnikovia cinnamomea]
MKVGLRTRVGAGVAALVGIGSVLVGAAPAMAHGSCQYVPDYDRRIGWGCVLDGHVQAYVHDDAADNKGLRIHLWTSTPGTKYVVGDGNGSQRGDGWKTVSGERITYYKVCAGVDGVDSICSPRVAA